MSPDAPGALERVLLALGSNIEPRRNLPAAVELLARSCEVVGASRVWETEPVGAPGSPRFLNAAVALRTGLEPGALKFDLLRAIEGRLGRVRGRDRDAPRTIDLDIAFFGDRVIDDPEGGLMVPDPDVLCRAHLALPLAEVDPGFRHPVDGRSLGEIAAGLAGAPGVRALAAPDLAAAAGLRG